jgi:hypothetical protein
MAWYMCNFCAVQYQRVSQNGGTHKNQNSLTIYVTILLVIVTSTVWNNHTSYFNFPIVNFLFTCSNIPAAPAYGVYNSQLIRYSIACGSYQDFLDRGLLLTGNLLNQSWSHHFESFMVATMTCLTVMEYLCHKIPWICSTCRKHSPVLSSFMTYHRVCN